MALASGGVVLGASAGGVLAADLVWAAAAAAGVSAVIVASEPAFLALRFDAT